MEADGTGSIVYGTNNVALVRSVLAIAGRKIDADAEDERKRHLAAEMQAQREAYLARARAELTARHQTAAAAVENVTA